MLRTTHEREHERGDADRGPHRLHAREVAVEARDGEEADAVEQERDRQQRRVGARREPPHREVRDDVEPEHRERGTPTGRRGCRGVSASSSST